MRKHFSWVSTVTTNLPSQEDKSGARWRVGIAKRPLSSTESVELPVNTLQPKKLHIFPHLPTFPHIYPTIGRAWLTCQQQTWVYRTNKMALKSGI